MDVEDVHDAITIHIRPGCDPRIIFDSEKDVDRELKIKDVDAPILIEVAGQ